jgi:serine phosphatase RsbU (regulator of sigma subunit)
MIFQAQTAIFLKKIVFCLPKISGPDYFQYNMLSFSFVSFSDKLYEYEKSLRQAGSRFFCLFCLISWLGGGFSVVFGQDRLGLHQKLERSNRTEEKIDLLLALARLDSVSDSAYFYAKKAEVLANNQKNREKQAEALAILAAYYDAQHNLAESIEHYQEAILLYTRLGRLEPQIRLQIALSKIFEQSGDKSNALDLALSALKNAEKLGKPTLLRHAYMRVGIAYSEIKENKKAEREVLNALAIDSLQRDSLQMAYSYNVLGTIAQAEKDYKKAFYFYMKSKEFYQNISDVKDLRIVLSSIGELLILQMNYNEALQYFTESYNIDEQFADIEGMAYNLAFIAEIYYKKRNYKRAIEYAEKSLGYALNTKSKQIVLKNYQLLSLFYEAQQDFKKALAYERKYSDLRNEIFEKNNAERLAEAQTLHQLDKKQKEVELYEKNAELAKEQARNTRYLSYFMIVSALGAIFYGFLFYRRYREKEKANILLQEQKKQIEAKNHELEQLNEAINRQRAELEQANEEMRITNTALDVANSQLNIAYQQVTSSIMYAKRIQDAMLPSIDKIKRVFPNSFILYQPRDIVSGDFYWFSEVGDKIVLVVADCTGHGVPGALMSMLGDAFLNLIINQQGKTKPDEILTLLHQNIYTALHQADRENQDGMDAAILTIDKKQRLLQFAGARLPLVYKRGTQFCEIKGDKMPIGGYRKQPSQTFQAHTIPIDAPLTLYLYSDGFQDQFGGEMGRKFMSRRFKDLLREIHHKSMPKQEQMLNAAFQKWTGLKYKQIDDILVVGLKFSPQDFFQEPPMQTLASSGNPYE